MCGRLRGQVIGVHFGSQKTMLYLLCYIVGGAVASWLVCSTLERAVWVWALAGDVVLGSWERHFTLTVPLFTQVYQWVPGNRWGNLTNMRGSDRWWTSILSRGSRNTSSRFMLETRISSGSYEPALAPRLHFFFVTLRIITLGFNALNFLSLC